MSQNRESIRLAYNGDGDLEYLGVNTISGIDSSLPSWNISKLVNAGGDLSYIEGPIMGAWDDRATLDWS